VCEAFETNLEHMDGCPHKATPAPPAPPMPGIIAAARDMPTIELVIVMGAIAAVLAERIGPERARAAMVAASDALSKPTAPDNG